MTPLGHQGVHAGACNEDHIGIESVGDFDDRPPTPDQYMLLLAVTRLIMEHWRLPPESVNVHNECMTGRTCPGKYLTGAQIRADLKVAWPRPPITKRYRARKIMISQRPEGGPPWAGELLPGEDVVVDKWYSNNLVHLQDQRGFVALKDLEPL